LPAKQAELPGKWPEWGDRRVTSDGDEMEETARLVNVDPLEQRVTLEIWIRLWRDGMMVQEERRPLTENEYFRNELVMLLEATGFTDVRITRGYSDREPKPEDAFLGITARKPE